MSESVPLLFDTDIGSDIDDAVALAYLLREPRCELLGITTVSGEPIERARLANAVCRAGGRTDIPIHAGVEPPLLVPLKQTAAPQKSVLANWEHRRDFKPNTAVPFLRETIRARPGEITLLAVGPFTNVGALFAMDPEIPSVLKRVVVMGGRYTTRTPGAGPVEWNASGDPHAMAIMAHAPLAELTAFGLDATLRCAMTSAESGSAFEAARWTWSPTWPKCGLPAATASSSTTPLPRWQSSSRTSVNSSRAGWKSSSSPPAWPG